MNRFPTRRRAFSLIEMMCVMALIAVIGLVMALSLREIFHVERLQSANFTNMLETSALADQFRADVSRAESTLHEWQDYVANQQTLILQMKAGGRVVYLWENDRLQRRAFENGAFTERTLPISDPQVRVEFVGPGQEPKLVRLRLQRMRGGEPAAGLSLEIAAALGGDWR